MSHGIIWGRGRTNLQQDLSLHLVWSGPVNVFTNYFFFHFSGPLRRFKRIIEHIQSQIVGRRPQNSSPRITRRPTNELSDSSSCGSESLSPTPPTRASDDTVLCGSNRPPAHLARCKSDQERAEDKTFHLPPTNKSSMVSNGRRSNCENIDRVWRRDLFCFYISLMDVYVRVSRSSGSHGLLP